MTTELTKAAQAALNACERIVDQEESPVQFGIDFRALGSSLRRAITQRPAAQEVGELEAPEPVQRLLRYAGQTMRTARNPNITAREAIEIGNYLASQPAPQQATPAAREVNGPITAALGDIVAVWDQHAPSEYMTAQHMQAKRALAGQQPMSPDMARWCAYVGGMVAHWVKSEPDALARLGDDAFGAAIAGIIERRLWAMPKQAAATPDPVGEPVAWRYKVPTHGGGTAWTHMRPQPECLLEAQPLYTHAPQQVPMTDEPQATPIPCAVHVCGKTFEKGAPFCDVIDHVYTSTRRQTPITEDQAWSSDEIMSANALAGLLMSNFMKLIRAVEAHHGITAQAKGGE